MRTLELYRRVVHRGKIRQPLSELGASYVIHSPRLHGGAGRDVTNQQTHEEMTDPGGQDQIPSLVDTARGESRYESDDIVEYLDEHYG